MEKRETPFIFYLTLENHLPKIFYVFDRVFKNLGFILVPVKIDQLQTLVSSSDQTEAFVICSVTDSRELRHYNEKIRPLLRYILKSKRISFMHLSSFSMINDFRTHASLKNYFFMKYPLDAAILSERIASYYFLKQEKSVRWPGGKRAGVSAIA